MPGKLEKVQNYGHPGTLAYKHFYYRSAIIGVLRPHRVVFSHRRYGQDRNFKFHSGSKNRWYHLFNVPENISVPFTYYDYSRAVGLMRVIEGLGVNFKYLMHLKSEFWFYRPLMVGDRYIIDYVFEDVRRIKHDKGAIIGYSAIKRNDELYQETRDHFVIKKIPEKYIGRLQSDDSGQFRGITRIPAQPLADAETKDIYIPAGLAKKYSRTSGDYNIVHTSAQLARLFGYDRPFIQGLCTANLIIKELVISGIELQYFSIVFCRPVFMQSKVSLVYNQHEFRLLDTDHNVLCFGNLNDGTKMQY